MPPIIAALVSTEDVRYRGHSGIDLMSLVRVGVKTVLMQNTSQGGGSTITQQLAKNLFPRDINENRGKIALFGGVKNARFRRKVTPGDVLEMECVLTKRRGPVGIGECKATVNGELACTAELTFAIGAE